MGIPKQVVIFGAHGSLCYKQAFMDTVQSSRTLPGEDGAGELAIAQQRLSSVLCPPLISTRHV